MAEPSRIHYPTLLSIVMLAAVYRAGIAAPDACISRDGVWFVEMANKLADDPVRHMQIETKQPGYSILLLAGHSLFGGMLGGDTPEAWQRIGTMIAGVGGVAVCAIVYLLTLRLFAPTVATVAGVFAAFWPDGARLSADVLSDMPHLALYLGAILVVIGASDRALIPRALAAGAIGGIAYWFRLEAIGLLPAVAIWLVTTAPKNRRTQAIFAAGLFVLAFAACAGPYVVLARLPATTEIAPGVAQTTTTTTIWANAVSPQALPGRLAEEWAKSGRYVFAALFLACLFIKSIPRATRLPTMLIGLVGAFHLMLVAARVLKYGELSGRYMAILAALTIPWAAAGFVYLVQLAIARSRDDSRYKFIPIWATGLMLAIFPLIYYGIQPINPARATLRAAGTWLCANASGDDVILADAENLAQVQFYAGHIYPHRKGWEKLERNADAATRREAIERIKPRWFVGMIDDDDEQNDAKQIAAEFVESFPAYETTQIFAGEHQRPVVIWKRVSE